VEVERRQEKSRGYFVGVIDGVGSGSSDFWVKTDHFSTFWWFFVRPADVSKAGTMVMGAGDESVSSAQLKLPETNDSGGF
jgi:hypothetical protein